MPATRSAPNAAWLHGFLDAVFPSWAHPRDVAVIRVYGDLSGTSRHRMHVAACYVGEEGRWARVQELWAKALNDARVEQLHATDFYACHGAFKNWKKGSIRHRQAENSFVSAIADHRDISGFGHAVETAAFDDEFRAVVAKMRGKYQIRSTRLLAVQMCLTRIADLVENSRPRDDERIVVVLEHEPGIGEVIDYFGHAKKQGAPWTKRILSITPGSKNLLPLQVADLFAHLCFAHMTHWISDHDSVPTGSYKRLLDNKVHDVRVTEANALRDALPEIRAFVEQYPSGIAWPQRKRPR